MDRRDFIHIGIAGSGGLLLTIPFSCRPKEGVRDKGVLKELNAYLSISTTGVVEIINPVPEIGQGVFTALPMLVAEELEVDWQDVLVKQADASESYEGSNQRAAGSYSIRAYWEPMRRAGAVARQVLIMAAADMMGTAAENCYAEKGMVYNRKDGSQLPYGELVSRAAEYEAPTEIILKSKADFNLIGKPQKSKAVDEITSGRARFGQDTRIENMHYASIEKHKVYGATVKSFNQEEVLSIPEVKWAFKIPYHGSAAERPYSREGVVVVATSAWGVLKGRKALQIEWNLGPNVNESTKDLHKVCEELVDKRGVFSVRDDGNVYGVLNSSDKVLEAIYNIPFIAHIPMETVNCTVDLKEDSCEVWSTTQMPNVELNYLANFLEMPAENIRIHIPRIGGGFGRRLGVDFTLEAVKIAQEIMVPVQLFWTREDDIQFDSFRPFSYHKMMAALNDQGKLAGWLHRQAGTSRYAFREGREPHESEFFPNHFPANLIPNFKQEYSLAESNLPRSLIRAPGNNALAFPVESFMDELANFAGRDPLEYRLELLGDQNRDFVFEEEEGDLISTERMKLVLQKAAKEAGWGKDLPKGRGMGIAGYFTFNTYVAHVAEVSVAPDTGQLIIHRFTSAIDCGAVVNPNGVRAQTEGAIMDGLSATLYQEITVADGATTQSNFHNYPVLRMKDIPKDIAVHIMENEFPPMGVGEPPYPPVAPALCNAIYSAAGIRIRKLPVGDQIKKAISNSQSNS